MTNMATYLDCPAERYSDLSLSELATVLGVSTPTSTNQAVYLVHLVPCQRHSHPKAPLPMETTQQQEAAQSGGRPAVGHLAAGAE